MGNPLVNVFNKLQNLLDGIRQNTQPTGADVPSDMTVPSGQWGSSADPPPPYRGMLAASKVGIRPEPGSYPSSSRNPPNLLVDPRSTCGCRGWLRKHIISSVPQRSTR